LNGVKRVLNEIKGMSQFFLIKIMENTENKYFLPYQIDWLNDNSRVKIWEKSRRIGATYVQSYEDVRDCVSGTVPAVWFSSADESAAKEYIIYCAKWAKLFDAGAHDLGEVVLDSEKDIKTFTIEFSNGKRINALSSNPKAFRSKGGKVILDEFAHHEDQFQLWKAAKPTITWGFPLRILSTHNGKQALFFKFIDSIRNGKLKWSLHNTDIFKAVEDGLADRILGKKLTQTERAQWLQEQEDDCFDETTWHEEFCCKPIDEATAFLSYEMIKTCESFDTLWSDDQFSQYLNLENLGSLFLGVDIGRRKDLTVMWLIEELGRTRYTRLVKIMEKTPFRHQREFLFGLLKHPKLSRACIDGTGLGMQLAEEAQEEFGTNKVEAITFTGRVKEEIAFDMKTSFEDRLILIPSETDIREDFHSIRKITTSSNNIRFDVTQSEVSGHADRFWAGALSNHAAKSSSGEVFVASRRKRSSLNITERY